MSEQPFEESFSPEEYTLYRVQMRSGECHIATEPRLPDGNTWQKWEDPRVQAIAGYHGYTLPDEIPIRRSYEEGTCERCGASGTENHHSAPRAIFGNEEAEKWPQYDLCRDCHVKWHRTIREHWLEVAYAGRQPHNEDPEDSRAEDLLEEATGAVSIEGETR